MSNLEQTLSIIKPDAVERNLIEEINSNISFKLEHIRKLTEDIERLTKIREAA